MTETFHEITREQETEIASRAIAVYQSQIERVIGKIKPTRRLQRNVAQTMLAYMLNREREEAERIVGGEGLCKKVNEFGVCAIVAGQYNGFVPEYVIETLQKHQTAIDVRLAAEISPAIYVRSREGRRMKKADVMSSLKEGAKADEVDEENLKNEGIRVVRAWWD